MSENALDCRVSVERLSDVSRRIAVEIPWPQVKDRLDHAYVDLGKGVSIKGFRRGRVPRKMLEQMFGKHVQQEVAQRLVQDSIGKALDDNAIAPVSEPKVDEGEIADGTDFCYSATLDVVPDIEPRDYFDVELTQRQPQVTDEAVEQALKSKQLEATEYTPIEGRNTERGDVLLVDLMGKVGDEPISRERELVELDDPPREPLPGVAEALTGIAAKPGDVEVELDLPVHDHGPDEPCTDHERTEHARLLVTIQDVKQKVVPPLDDEFAKDTGEAETLDGLRDKLRDGLIEADQERARRETKDSLIEKILETNDVPAVPSLVERHLAQMAQFQLAMMGGHGDEAAIKEQMRGDAEKAVRSALLVQAIADKEKVEVNEADIEKRLAEIASQRSQNVAKVRSEYDKEGRIEQLRRAIREEKTLDLLLSKSQITEGESPTPQDSSEDSSEA